MLTAAAGTLGGALLAACTEAESTPSSAAGRDEVLAILPLKSLERDAS